MKVRVSTTNFQFAHGKMPRGRGNWGFFVGNPETLFWAPANSTFADAKKAAVAEAKRVGADFVTVAS